MKKTYFLSIFVAGLILQSCVANLGKDVKVGAESQNYSYNLSENGCSTGDHSFSSLDSMCDGLKDDSLNNQCAYNLRRMKFESECPGRGSF